MGVAGFGLMTLRGSDPLGTVGATAHRFRIGGAIETNSGLMAVNHAEAVSGPSDSDIRGGHGVPDLVKAGSIDVQVNVMLTNSTEQVSTYSPTHFELLDGTGRSIAIERAAPVPGALQP